MVNKRFKHSDSNVLKGILIGSLFLLVWGTVIYLILRALDMPEVEMSWSTKECKRVVYMDGTVTNCDVLPENYDIVWVK
jgi:hypothetical protein